MQAMYQAIQTKYFGPSNVRGSRVKARCGAGSVVLDWADELNVDENHMRAALALARKLKWDTGFHGVLHGGVLPGNAGYAFVFVKED